MTTIFLVLECIDYEGSTVRAVCTTRALAEAEADQWTTDSAVATIVIHEMSLTGAPCAHPGCGGTEVAITCDRCRSY